jgi:hypothetical protein
MADKRITPRALILLALTVTAGVVLVAIWPGAAADTPGSNPLGVPRDSAPQIDPAVPPALGLERMEQPRPVPQIRRDLFRLGAATPDPVENPAGGGQTPQPSGRGRRGTPIPVPPPVETPPIDVAPAPIPLRFVSIVQTPTGLVAGLSDGKSVFAAREGDVVEGRWRIVKIGAESLVIERIDGTGRQTIRGPG